MKFFRNINEDLETAKRFSLTSKSTIFFFNRGFHSLFYYRLANSFYRHKIPGLPAILTRFIQILYAIDIDYKASLNGGIVIVHGTGLVIGAGAIVDSNVVLFHGVTLGRRGVGPIISESDGYPHVEENCIICTGAILLGKITIGKNTTIGANCLVKNNVAPDSIFQIPDDHFVIRNK